MAVTKITWENKEGIQNDESIARKNKVMDDDMNEIKQVVNNNADELNIAQSNIENLQSGQGTANTDITNLKSRVTTLETDNTQNKSDINTLKSDNETNKSNIQQLQNKQQETETNVGTLQGKVNTLETDNTQNKENIENLQEDNVQNKADISTLKLDNESNKTNISTLQENVSNLDTNKVDKVEGKGLSSNDFTNEYKQKLDNLENYNDTEIKEEIESLKSDNTTNKSNIENLQENDATQNELISKLKSALINVETEQAKSLHIEDASTVSAQLSVEGNAEQETREGYNLLDINKGVISNDCTMTQISKSEYKITVNNNADWARIDIPISLLSTKTYRASIYTKVSNANARIEIGTYKDNTQYGSKLSNNSTDYKKQIIDNVETNINRFVIWLNPDSVSEEFEVYIKELMLYEGSEEKEYEPYGAMPSPKFPSAIKCLGSNKNLFDKNNVNITNLNAINQENGTFEIATNQKHIYIECKALTSYSITKSILADTTLGIYETGEIPAVNVNYHQLYLKSVSTGIATVKTGENAKYLDIRLNTNALTEEELQEILDTLKIEEGTMATSYSPYGQGSTEIKKINKNLLDDTAYKNITIASQDDISVIDYQEFDNFKKNKTYIARIWFTDGTYIDDNNIMLYAYNANKTSINTIPNTVSKVYDNADEIKYVKLQINSSGFEKYKNKTIRGIQIEESSVVTDYVEHQQENYTLPIQQEMLPGDCWTKEEDGWKEVHIWSKIRFLNQNFKKSTKTEVSRYFVSNIVDIVEDRYNVVVLSEHFLGITSVQNDNNELGISNYNDNGFLINIDKADTNFDTLKKFETFLQNNEVYAYYKTTTPTKLTCTEEQSAILDKLNELDMLNGTNNIITTEDIALLKLNYVADTKTYVDNQIADMQNQLNTINELLSTTATSSILLDNLQTDLEGEVM